MTSTPGRSSSIPSLWIRYARARFRDPGNQIRRQPAASFFAALLFGLVCVSSGHAQTSALGFSQDGRDHSSVSTTSNVIDEVVPGAPDFTLTITPNPASIGVGLIVALKVNVTSINGFSDAVALSCPASLPTETTCTFSEPAISGETGPAILYITTTSPHDCGTTAPYFFGTTTQASVAPYALAPVPSLPSSAKPGELAGTPRRVERQPAARGLRTDERGRETPGAPAGRPGPYWTTAMAGLVMVLIPRRRFLKFMLSALLCVFLGGTLMNTTGCGHCTDLGTKPATYTIPVTGKSSGVTSITHTADVKLTVQP